MRARGTRRTSCGVLVTDGDTLLLGHAALSPLWDIPKGVAEPGEDFAAAALRELREETGLVAPPEALRALGVHRYLPAKDLALFLWRPAAMPDPRDLRCSTYLRRPDGRRVPEMDAFAVLPRPIALTRLGRNMVRVLGELRSSPGWADLLAEARQAPGRFSAM